MPSNGHWREEAHAVAFAVAAAVAVVVGGVVVAEAGNGQAAMLCRAGSGDGRGKKGRSVEDKMMKAWDKWPMEME